MVKKVVGYDEQGNAEWSRDARAYDQSISKTIFGLSIGDIVKSVPIFFLCGMVWANQQNVNKQMIETLAQISSSTEKNSSAISGIKDVLNNLNMYLSATTGKQFKDGIPR